jgi:hypothetical protein
MTTEQDDDRTMGEMMAMGLLAGALNGGSLGAVVARPELATKPKELPRVFLRFPGVLYSEYEATLRFVPGTALPDATSKELKQAQADRLLNILGRASNVVEISWSMEPQEPGSLLDTLLAAIGALAEAIAPRS